MPGIYDSVSLELSDNPVMETIQVAPRIGTSEIVVQTRLKNYGPEQLFQLRHSVSEWKGTSEIASSKPECIHLNANEEKLITQHMAIPRAHL